MIDLGNGVKMEMISVPAGTFVMGSPAGEDGQYADERPQRRVTISNDFWMGKHEVTQAQWQRVMGENPSCFTDAGASAPVESVSWDDCQEFLRKLNLLVAGISNGPAATGFRLPTEAEWEYACRAGSTTRFAGGDEEDDLDRMAWYLDNSDETTHPAGKKKGNAWGLQDMHGNVCVFIQSSCRDTARENVPR